MKPLFIRLLLIAAATGVVLCAEGFSSESSSKTQTEPIPKYKIERKIRLKALKAKPGLVIHVSVAPSDVQQDKLLALSRKLAEKHRTEEAFFLFIFDDAKAAREYEFAAVEVRSPQNSLRAMYSFVRTETRAHFMWYPNRGDKAKFIRITLDMPRSK